MATKSKTKVLEMKRDRLYELYEYYKQAEIDILEGKKIQSYGIGSRSATRYPINLETVHKYLEQIEEDLMEIEDEIAGNGRRKAIYVTPQDW